MFLGEEEDFSVNMDEEVFLSDAYFSIACFCIKPSVFFLCLFGSTSLPFPFSRDSLKRVRFVNFPLVFVGLDKERNSNYSVRVDLFPLSSLYCISSIISINWKIKYYWKSIW